MLGETGSPRVEKVSLDSKWEVRGFHTKASSTGADPSCKASCGLEDVVGSPACIASTTKWETQA